MTTIRSMTAAALIGAALSMPAQPDDRTAVTIYSSATPGAIPADLYRPVPGTSTWGYTQSGRIPGYAVVKRVRTLDLERGVSSHAFTGVAALIDPTTVLFESLTDPDGTSVLEQSYRFDLLNMDKMLSRYIDKEIIIDGQRVSLLSVTSGGLLIRGDEGTIKFRSGYKGVAFPRVADGLITTPTLEWTIDADRAGAHETRLSYETRGMTWWADYNLVFHPGPDENSGTIDLGAWVSILNQSGGTYEDATLKLIAGDVNRARRDDALAPSHRAAIAMEDARSQGFEEKAFFEYHLYTLGRPATIPDRSTKQIELFEPARSVAAEKLLMFDATSAYMRYGGRHDAESFGLDARGKVRVYLRFDNDEAEGLGVPLPKGRVRVSQTDDADGSLEFIGEDTIDHTPRNETITIMMGNAFDVVGERRQVSFERGKRWMTETIEVKIRNQKDRAVGVHIKEHLYRWTNARVTACSHERDMLDARTMMIPVSVEPEGEAVVTYTVHYSW